MRTTQKGWGKASGRKAMLLLGMSAMALAFVAMMAGCGDSGGGGGGGGTPPVTLSVRPDAGAVAYGTTIRLNSTSSGTSIYYTTDESTPTASSTPYSLPIPVTAAVTIKAIGVKSGMTDSDVLSAAYTIKAADVIITAGNLNNMASLIAAATGGASQEDSIVVAITIANATDLSGNNTGGTDPLHKLFEAIPSNKYVAFDLSDCTFTSIADITPAIANARQNKDRLASIKLPNTLTTIGNNAFNGCKFSSITIPNSVTTIGNQAFNDCIYLTSVTIPNSVTAIGSAAFAGCGNLSAIQVGTSNTNYTAIDGVLFNNDRTTLIAYPAEKGGATYTIPSSVTAIDGYAFYKCGKLTSITIPGSVTTIGNYAFNGCISLASVTIPASVTAISNSAFAYCSSLTSVTIPASVTAIGESAFTWCSRLESVYVLRDTTGSLTTLGSMAFNNTHTNLKIYVPTGKVTDYQGMTNWNTYTSKIQAMP